MTEQTTPDAAARDKDVRPWRELDLRGADLRGAKLRALDSSHTTDLRALDSSHTTDLRALDSSHTDLRALDLRGAELEAPVYPWKEN